MNATAIDPAAEDAQVYRLDRFAGGQSGAQAGLRVAPYPLEPTVWVEHRCPACGETYGNEVEACLLDGRRLDDVIVSRPFLWLG